MRCAGRPAASAGRGAARGRGERGVARRPREPLVELLQRPCQSGAEPQSGRCENHLLRLRCQYDVQQQCGHADGQSGCECGRLVGGHRHRCAREEHLRVPEDAGAHQRRAGVEHGRGRRAVPLCHDSQSVQHPPHARQRCRALEGVLQVARQAAGGRAGVCTATRV